MDHITDHEARALARLIQQYRASESHARVVALMTAEHQVLEDEMWSMYAEDLDAAVGKQLDVWGRLVKQDRDPSWDDDLYRAWIRIRLMILLAGGTGDLIIRVFQAALVDGVVCDLTEDFPAGLTLRLRGSAPVLRWSNAMQDVMPAQLDAPLAFGDVVAGPALLKSLLEASKAAGVRGVVEWMNSAPEDAFTLNTGPGLGVGILAGGAVVR